MSTLDESRSVPVPRSATGYPVPFPSSVPTPVERTLLGPRSSPYVGPPTLFLLVERVKVSLDPRDPECGTGSPGSSRRGRRP